MKLKLFVLVIVISIFSSLTLMTANAEIFNTDFEQKPDTILVNDCLEISQPGYYQLINDIQEVEEDTCIYITATQNVVFDGGGYEIEGDIEDTYYAILIDDSTNITIKNVNLSLADTGIGVWNSSGVIIENSNLGDEIVCIELNDNTKDTIIRNNNIIGCSEGSIDFFYTNNISVYGNLFKDMGEYVFGFFWSGFNNKIFNNYIKSHVQQEVLWGGDINQNNNFQWYLPKTLGQNIVGGPYLAGNYWANVWGTGVSQRCTDLDVDGICDTANKVLGKYNNIDRKPLATWRPEANISPVAPK